MKNIIILWVLLILSSCVGFSKTELPIGSKIYEIEYPSDWVKNDQKWLSYGDLLNIQKRNPKYDLSKPSSPDNLSLFGNFSILISKKDQNGLCVGVVTESKESNPYVNYKKDKVLINGKYVDRWSSKEGSMSTEIFFDMNDENCIRLTLASYVNSNEIEKDFSHILESFHQVKR